MRSSIASERGRKFRSIPVPHRNRRLRARPAVVLPGEEWDQGVDEC